MSANGCRFNVGRIHVASSQYAEFAGPWPEEPGVRLSVIVTSPDAFVTGIWSNAEDAELHSFSDDTGLDLLANGGGCSAVGAGSDHQAALFEIQGRSAPAPGALRLNARGRIQISTASGVQAHKSAGVSVKSGERISVGGFEFEIGLVEKSRSGGQEIEFIRYAKEQQFRGVSRLWFEDLTGNPLQVQELGSTSNGVDDDLTVRDGFQFSDQSDAIVIVVELWVGRVETLVDYDVTTTIGCGT